MTALLALATGLLLTAADDPARAPSDLDRLQGVWQLVAMERDGESAAPEELTRDTATYEGNRITLRSGEKVRRRGIITLDPSRTPKAINTWDLDGPFEDQTIPGIYELDGDTLRLCFGGPGELRPRTFTTKGGQAFLMVVYKRKKP